MNPIRCFELKPIKKSRLWLRRYTSGTPCPNDSSKYSYHCAKTLIGDVDISDDRREIFEEIADSDPRWPVTCEKCAYVFQTKDERQNFTRHLYARSDTGAIMTQDEAPPGAIIDATWLHGSSWCGLDGRSIIVKIPEKADGTGTSEWMVDGPANNCTLPDDKVHRCWCRHGEVPNLTIDKVGVTCSAGAGSILCHGGFHGFLREGYIVMA